MSTFHHFLSISAYPTGCLELVGSLELQISSAKESYKRDYILQKRPMILRSLLIVATPCHEACLSVSLSVTVLVYKRDYILQKRPMILRSLQIVATPYHEACAQVFLLHSVCVCVCVC